MKPWQWRLRFFLLPPKHMKSRQLTKPWAKPPANKKEQITSPGSAHPPRTPRRGGKVHGLCKLPCYCLLSSQSSSKLLCKNVPQHIFPEISHLWKLQCVLHFGSFWHLNDARFESVFELLYKKKFLCLPSLPPVPMFCLLPYEVCTWTEETRLVVIRVLDPGHGKNFFWTMSSVYLAHMKFPSTSTQKQIEVI